MSIIEDLKWRYATKQFDSKKKVSPEYLDKILEALILTPSSFGLQTWRFVVVENQETKEKLLEHSWNQKQVVDSSHLIVFCRLTKFDDSDIDRFIESTAKIREQSIESLSGYANMMKGFYLRWMETQLIIG